MRKRYALLGGMAALSLTALLVGCDPKKSEDTSGTSGATAASGTSAPGSTGTSTSSAATTTSATPGLPTTFAPAFDKPLKPDASAALQFKVITNGNSPFWDSMGIGLSTGLKTVSAQGGWNAPQQTDNSSQKDTFEQALASNANGVAVSPIQADAFAPVIDSAIERGVPVITFDSDSPTSKRLAYIGTNNYDAGKMAGEAAVKLFPNGAKLVAFVGNMTADNAKQRYQGFVDATKDHNISMLQEPYVDDKDATGRAHQNVADAITKYNGQINGLVGLYSYNGPAIVSEVQKAGLIGKVKIICFDCEPQTVDNLRKKLVDVTVVQKPYEFGRLSALLLAGINRKGLTQALQDMKPELDKNGMKLDMEHHVIDTGVQIVTPDNADQFLKDLNAKGLKSS